MKFSDFLLAVLVVAVGYLIWKDQQKQPIAIATKVGEDMALPWNRPTLSYPKTKKPLAQTFTIGSEPKQFPKGQTVSGVVKVTADDGNAGDIFIGNSYADVLTGQHRYSIFAGDSHDVEVTELSDLWYYGTEGDVVSIITEIWTN